VGFHQAVFRFGSRVEAEAWWIMLAFGGAGLLLAHFFFRLTVSRLRSERGNRDVAPRLALMMLVYGGALILVATFFLLKTRHPGGPEVAQLAGISGMLMMIVLAVGTVFCADTSERLSPGLRTLWTGKPLRRLFFFPGLRRLMAFFLANAAVCALPILWAVVANSDHRLTETILRWGIGAFSTVAIGLAAHHYLVMPFCRNRKPPPVFATFLVANLFMGLLYVAAAVFHHAGNLPQDFVTLATGLCPPAMMLESFDYRAEAGPRLIGTAFAGVLVVLLFMAVISLARSDRKPETAADSR